MTVSGFGPDAKDEKIKALYQRLVGWMRENRADYLQAVVQAVGERHSGWIRSYHDNRPYDNVAPAELYDQMIALRSELAEPGSGAFTYAKFVVEAGTGTRMTMRQDSREPQLDPPYTAQDCTRELELFPRDDERTPTWLASHGQRRDEVTSVKQIDDQVLEHYRPLVPEAIGDLWSQYGVAYFDDGMVRLVDPAHAVNRLQRVAPAGDDMVPVFTTALADVIYWRAGRFVFYDYRHGTSGELDSNALVALYMLHNQDFRNEFMDGQTYRQVACRYGILDPDDCFAYIPLLRLGGPEDVNRLDPCQMWTHLEFIAQATGTPQEP